MHELGANRFEHHEGSDEPCQKERQPAIFDEAAAHWDVATSTGDLTA